MVSQSSLDTCNHTRYVYSGCTSHMANEENMFCELGRTVNTRVELGNGQVVESQGKGTVAVQSPNGTKNIQNVLYIPSLRKNLLSVAQMISDGYSLIFKNRSCCIFDQNNRLIVEVKMIDKYFSQK